MVTTGDSLLELARACGRDSLFVVGTGKNAGKTVVMRAIAEAAAARGLRIGLTSTGRDGEAVDLCDGGAKPRLRLTPPTVLATARGVLPEHPASELLEVTDLATAAGPVVFARVRSAANYEVAGPPTAAGIRHCVRRMREFGCDFVLVDGAVDRVAALAGGEDAVVIATGASGAPTMEQAVEDARALAMRLRVARFDPSLPFMQIEGALTAARAAQLAADPGVKQIVVRDPTQIAFGGKALLGALQRLQIRCERPLNVLAATIASIGRDRSFEPRAFARAVADATALPVFDVYAESMTAV